MSSMVGNLNVLTGKNMYAKTKTQEAFEFVILTIIGLLIPLVFQHPQLLVGAIVNFVLIQTAINIKGWGKISTLFITPSISAVLGGYLFGSFTIFLAYLLPFIWLGNATLVFVMKSLYVEKKKNYFLALTASAAAKAAFLFVIAIIMIKLSIIPAIFATAMGVLQLGTALLGGVIALPVNMIYKKYFTIEA